MPTTGLGQFGFGVKNHRFAQGGKYFMATNPTPGTGIISGAVTSLADTTPYILVRNNNPIASGVCIYPDFLRLHVTVVGVGHTSPKLTLKLDTAQGARTATGGTTITPVSTGGGIVAGSAFSAPTTNAQIFVGALTAGAGVSAVLLDTFQLASAIEVVNDTWTVDFGSPTGSIKAALADNSTTITHGYFPTSPVCIGPQQVLTIHLWAASLGTGITAQPSLGYIEV